jgi:competence protein ComFB
MGIREEVDFGSLVNEAERLVIEELERQLERLESVPKTEESILDMAALALNNVPPFYHVSLLGKLYASSIQGTEYTRRIEKAVREAIRKVAANPPPGP